MIRLEIAYAFYVFRDCLHRLSVFRSEISHILKNIKYYFITAININNNKKNLHWFLIMLPIHYFCLPHKFHTAISLLYFPCNLQ